MQLRPNLFKTRLADDQTQYGLWVNLADPIAAEISAGAGFDWLLLDGEHAPNNIRTLLNQLQTVEAYPVSPLVRPPNDDPVLLKQLLDIGVQTFLIPMVDSAEQAQRIVASVRYPPAGVRGVATTRASRWGRIPEYWKIVDDEICVVTQIETLAGLENLEAIAETEGVDALFVGPADLGAALGHLGQPNHPEVVSTVQTALGRIRDTGKAAGVLGVTPQLASTYAAAGATFVGVGVDTAVLATATSNLAAQFKGSPQV